MCRLLPQHPPDSQRLYHRGCQGVILAVHPRSHFLEDLDWSRFAMVQWGHGSVSSPYDSVAIDFYHAARGAFHECWNRGYRRIGMVHIRPPTNRLDRTDHLQRIGAYLVEQEKHIPRGAAQIPLLLLSPDTIDSQLQTWINDHQPDAVIAFPTQAHRHFTRLGYPLGTDLGFVGLYLDHQHPEVAHFEDTNVRRRIEIALRLLDPKIRTREHGKTETKISVRLSPQFVSGPTLPDQAEA